MLEAAEVVMVRIYEGNDEDKLTKKEDPKYV